MNKSGYNSNSQNLIIKIDALELCYGNIAAVRSCSFSLKKHECLAMIGANGAGKTTLLKGLAGIKNPRKGKVFFKGQNITQTPPHMRSSMGITLVPEGRGIFARLTVKENLLLGGYAKKMSKLELKENIEKQLNVFPQLKEKMLQLAGTLSGGEQQMLSIARALIGEPELLLLDEPSMGLAPIVTEQIFKVIASIKEEGVSIIIVEQNAALALETADMAIIIESGEITRRAKASELLEDDSVQKAYLGV